MNKKIIWDIIRLVICILYIAILVLIFSILMSLYTDIDFQNVFTFMSLLATIIALIYALKSGKTIKDSNILNKDIKTNIDNLDLKLTDLDKIINTSNEMSKKTDNTLTSMLNLDFQKHIGLIEDLRFKLKEPNNLLVNREIMGWKCYTYIRESVDIISNTKVDIQSVKRFLNIFNHYLGEIKKIRKKPKNAPEFGYSYSLEEIHHLFMMFKKILNLDKFFTGKELTKLDYKKKTNRAISHLRYIIRENEDVKIDLEYITKIDNILSPIRKENKTEKFYNVDKKIRDLYNS